MNAELIDTLDECTRLSKGSTGAFPTIVARLTAAGVERYHADLRRAEKVYYMPGGESHASPAQAPAAPIAQDFDTAAIAQALRASQANIIDYDEFLRRIAKAGCVSYVVSLVGRRALYLGRNGDSYTEYFPSAA
jgi:uncharacterized protein YbcV (DUF1398 family)